MANATEDALTGLRKRDLHRFLESDPRVREWLAEQLLSTKEAAEVIGVERPRIWRWEKAHRLSRVATTGATPVYLRVDCEHARDDEALRVAGREARHEPDAA